MALQKENFQVEVGSAIGHLRKKNPFKSKKRIPLREKNPKPKCHNLASFRHMLLFPMRALVAFFASLMAMVKDL